MDCSSSTCLDLQSKDVHKHHVLLGFLRRTEAGGKNEMHNISVFSGLPFDYWAVNQVLSESLAHFFWRAALFNCFVTSWKGTGWLMLRPTRARWPQCSHSLVTQFEICPCKHVSVHISALNIFCVWGFVLCCLFCLFSFDFCFGVLFSSVFCFVLCCPFFN